MRYTSKALACGGALALAASGCSFYDFEDPQPIDSVATSEAITNLASARAARAGIYDALQLDNAFDGYLASWQYFSDEADWTGTFPTREEFDVYTVVPPNGTLASFYTDFYQISNTANSFISGLSAAEDSGLTPEVRASFEAEARFARGIAYFYLTQGWVDVPLVLEPTVEATDVLNVASSPQSAVYDQIEADLQYVVDNIDESSSLGANAAAANALLARVALYRQDYGRAYDLAVAALGSDSFDLAAFPFLGDDLFDVEYSSTDGNSFAFFYAPSSLNGRLSISPGAALIDAFEEGDLRRAQTIDTLADGTYYGLKYDDFDAAGGSQADPIRIIRRGEVVLIAAEAAAAQGDFDTAEKWLNQVRSRAGLDDIDDLDADNYIDAILQERFVELAFEAGHRLWDLRRTGRALDVLGEAGYDPCDDRWPFPQREIDRNPNLEKNSACNS